MALNFKPLKLDDPGLFGIKLSGSVGRGDRDRLKELADKCLANGKVNVVLDLSGLTTMGGGGARMVAELRERLQAAEGGAVIAGAGDTVKRFLDQKFSGDPLEYYPTAEAAAAALGEGCGTGPRVSTATAVAEPGDDEPAAADTGPAAEDVEPPAGSRAAATGAVGVADVDGEMDDLLDEFTVQQTAPGRRKDHHYASLTEALEAMAERSDRNSQMDFNDALKNLLFSQGLARDVTLLMVMGNQLVSPDGFKEIPLSGSLAIQAEQAARPMTMLDLRDENLTEEELSLLEAVDPDMILPVLGGGTLRLLMMVKKGGEDREYSVAENFAFELLQQVLEKAEGARDRERSAGERAVARPAAGRDAGGAPDRLKLEMALELPEADDLPHFWRLFARIVEPVMDLQDMAFLAADRPRPQTMLGGGNLLVAMDCSEARLQKFFRAMELPVRTENLPATFAALKQDLQNAGVDWIISLKHGDDFLGTLFLSGRIAGGGDFSTDLVEIFALAGRLLLRCDDFSSDDDPGLEVIRRLVIQREKRCHGAGELTGTMVEHLTQLAREMGFAADQKRDLILGCLLRDVGLVDKDDALMGSPADMTPAQWKSYRNHPSEGAALLGELELSKTVLEVVKCHHERFNGEGFPAGLSGRDIPLAARVVTVVENFVTMTAGLGGLEARSPAEAAAVLRENLGERYDPDIVAIFLSVVEAG